MDWLESSKLLTGISARQASLRGQLGADGSLRELKLTLNAKVEPNRWPSTPVKGALQKSGAFEEENPRRTPVGVGHSI